jgi:hypothetical protein
MLLGRAIVERQEIKHVQIMSGLDAVLVQYRVYAQRRLHFGGWRARTLAVLSLGFLGVALMALGSYAILIWDR